MPDYRLYFVDANNHIRRRLDLECRDDAHAIEAADEHARHDIVELWRRDRLVKRFEPAMAERETGSTQPMLQAWSRSEV